MTDRTRADALPIQLAVAAAAPRAWRDGIVIAVESDEIQVLGLDGALDVLTGDIDLAVGEPVAFHPIGELLAIGARRVSVRPVRSTR